MSAALIDRILSAAQAPELWSDALDLYASEYDIPSVSLFAMDTADGARMDAYFSALARSGALSDIRQRFVAGEDEGDAQLYQRLFLAPPRELLDERSVFGLGPNAALPASPFREALAEIGLCERYGAALNRNGPWLDVLTMHDGSPEAARRVIEDPMQRLLVTAIARSVEIGRTMSSLRARYKAALGALDRLELGAVLATNRRHVIFANIAARRILDEADGLALSQDGRIVARAPARDEDLAAALTAAEPEARRGAEELLLVPRRSGARDLILSAAALKDAEGEVERDLRCVFILIIDPDDGRRLDTAALAALGGLTEAEQAVVGGLGDGLRLDEIADARSTSRHTVRSQFRSIAGKLRCSSQAEVLRLAALTRPPLAKD